MPAVILKKGEGRTIKAGGAWIYDNEIDRIEGSFENGDVVEVRDFDGYFMGQGFINTASKITVRMLSRKKDVKIDEKFIGQRVRDAWNYRKEVIDTSSCRVIFGEADFLPGIVIDKFSDVLVVESLALGIDKWKLTIVDALKKVMAEDGINIRGVYERSDAKVRLQEGMERSKGFIGDAFEQMGNYQTAYTAYYILTTKFDDAHATKCCADMQFAGKGIEKDVQNAFYLMIAAAEGGDVPAMFAAGEFMKGQSKKQAAYWYGLSHSRGYGPSLQRLIQLAQ